MATQNPYIIADGLLANNAAPGEYHVYFTELDEDGITEVADVVTNKVDYNNIRNAPNAAAGNYNDAIGENSYLHPLNKVAFSGSAQDLSGLSTVAVSGDYNDLRNKPSIENFDLSVSYEEIEGAPGITAGEYADNENEESYLHNFDKVAFSGEYGDLSHAPGLPENAYETQLINGEQVPTGNINPLNKAAFGDFSDLSQSDYTTNYIISLPLTNATLCENESGSFDFTDDSLRDTAVALYNGFAGGFEAFINHNKTVYLMTQNRMIYMLLSAKRTSNNAYHFIFTPVFTTNYDSISSLSESDLLSELTILNNNLAEKLIVIFDWNQTKLYWKLISNSDSDFARSPASDITIEDIEDWNNKSNFSGNYEDLQNKPNIPFSGYTYELQQPDAEHEEEWYLRTGVKDFGTYAFLNEIFYSDIQYPPSYNNNFNFAKVAFSGSYNELSDLPKSLVGAINIADFTDADNSANNNKIQSLGNENIYILDFDHFISNTTNYTLKDTIYNITDDFLHYGKQFYLINNQYRFFITNITRSLINNNYSQPNYIKFEYCSLLLDNYDTIQYNGNNLSNEDCTSILNNLQLKKQFGYIIFDYVNNVIFCKIEKDN